jgi:porin
MFHASLSSRIQSSEQRYSETAIEMFYKLQLTPFFSIKPDLQYIVNPGGDLPNAFVAGLRMEVAF